MMGRSQELVDNCCWWIKSNRKTLNRIMHLIHKEVERGNPGVQRDHIYTLAMQSGMRVSDCDELRRNHNLWSVLTRYMVMLSPVLARSLAFRRCGIDDVDLVEAWERIIGPGTLFHARGYEDALRLIEIGDVAAQVNPRSKPKRGGSPCEKNQMLLSW